MKNRRHRTALRLLTLVATALLSPVVFAGGDDWKGFEAPPVYEPEQTELPGVYLPRVSDSVHTLEFDYDEAEDTPEDTTTGLVSVEVDSVPITVYLDGRPVVFSTSRGFVQFRTGHHFISLYPAERVHRAFRREIPQRFWNRLRDRVELASDYALLSGFELSAVRAGTKWVRVSKTDTAAVSLSWDESRRAYVGDARRAGYTFFGLTAVIAVAMVISQILVNFY
uniref:PEGA domain-containing protein n=1 Tax=candidate division WOR-3 bacterium TaxID=2052148 RepID=A0A7C4GA36_UNCW3